MLRLFLFLFFLPLYTLAADPRPSHLTMSLKEAILLAMRENPNVQQAEVGYLLQKYNLEVAEWEFKPHYSLTAKAGITKTIVGNERLIAKGIGVKPEISLLSPIGTKFKLISTNNLTGQFRPGLSLLIEQPLMRGYGRAIVQTALHNAIDSERISRLTMENALRNSITLVIQAYLDVVSAENTVKIDKDALKRAEETVSHTKLFIKAGRKAGVELISVEAEVAKAQTTLENDKNNLAQMRYALLTAIGIDPNTPFSFTNIDVSTLINQYFIPTLEDTTRLSLENDIQYQIDQITIQGAKKRAVAVAEDNTRWQLNLTANGAVGSNQTEKSLVNVSQVVQGVDLNLTVPINDKLAKQALMGAKVALREAAIALQQLKWKKETNAINNWNTLFSSKRAMVFAEEAARLQQKTYEIHFQKYSYGLINSIELRSAQQQLVSAQQALLTARISYLKALISLDQQIGRTLKTWDIPVRYL